VSGPPWWSMRESSAWIEAAARQARHPGEPRVSFSILYGRRANSINGSDDSDQRLPTSGLGNLLCYEGLSRPTRISVWKARYQGVDVVGGNAGQGTILHWV
jgi:hypothetical protein